MTSTHSTNQIETFPRLRRLPLRSAGSPRTRSVGARTVARIGVVVCAAVGLVPVAAVSSSGAGTTAVAPATNDPIALAAASALDLLRGGSGAVRQPATVVDSVAPAAVVSSSASSVVSSVVGSAASSVVSAPQTVPPSAQTTAPAGAITTNSSNTTIVDTNQLTVPKKIASADGPSQFANSQFANSPVVSLLPTPTDVTIPASSNSQSGAPATTVPTTKKTSSKKTTSSVAAVAVDGSAAPAGLGTGGANYDSVRRTLATLVAGRLPKLSVDQLDAAWASAEPRRMMAVYAALAQVGTNYRWSGNEPGGFDCSGLTSYAWSVAGVRLPRTSTDQIAAASPRMPKELLPGDLVWRPGHIMMYLGAGEYGIDSPQTGKKVTVRQWGRTSRYGSPI